jgi:hypothetical protein
MKFFNRYDPPRLLFRGQPTGKEEDVTDTSSGDDTKESRSFTWPFDEQPTGKEDEDVTDTSSGDDKREPRRSTWARRPTWKKRAGGV